MSSSKSVNIGSLTVYFQRTAQGIKIDYVEQAGKPYPLTPEEYEEVIATLERLI